MEEVLINIAQFALGIVGVLFSLFSSILDEIADAMKTTLATNILLLYILMQIWGIKRAPEKTEVKRKSSPLAEELLDAWLAREKWD